MQLDPQTSHHGPDVVVLLGAFAAALFAQAMTNPWGTLTVVVALASGCIRLAINVRDWWRGR